MDNASLVGFVNRGKLAPIQRRTRERNRKQISDIEIGWPQITNGKAKARRSARCSRCASAKRFPEWLQPQAV